QPRQSLRFNLDNGSCDSHACVLHSSWASNFTIAATRRRCQMPVVARHKTCMMTAPFHARKSMIRSIALVLVACSSVVAAEPVTAVVESTLKTDGGHIRQFAFDGDANSYFGSDKAPGKDDHFTLTFDKPVKVKSISVTTGRPKGEDSLGSGSL